MGYLLLDHALNMDKVTISFWFRVPKESADAVQAATGLGAFWDYQVFNGVIPVITWGRQQTAPVTGVEVYDTGNIDVSGGAITLERISGSHAAPLQPSCIGVYLPYVGSGDKPSLHVHIQTNIQATGTGLATIRTNFTGDFVGMDVHSGKPVYTNIEYVTEDVSYIITEEPEYLGNIDSSGAGYPEVRVDEWNHLLISWELIGGDVNKMWCAINDVNKDGFDLPAMNEVTFGMGPNNHTSHTLNIYHGASVSVSFAPESVPSYPFQIPGPASVNRASNNSGGTVSIEPIVTVELAELQIFTGVALDTSDLNTRRLFVSEGGEPIDPRVAEKSLRMKPDVLLHGSSNWKNGKNTGSLKVDFVRTGTINTYKPDPSLYGLHGLSKGHRGSGPIRLTKAT